MEIEIKNFVIISHINHGKSTLADRFLELTATVSSKKMRPQFLDMMELERERGITISMQPVRMEFDFSGAKYILNLIDTPGHVDFSYEVSRSLAAVEGAILLVDASQGIQAQTLANLDLAQKQNLVIIPVVNKIDLTQADVEKTVKELSNLLKIDEKEIIKISAKNGTNVRQLLEVVIKKVPSPKKEKEPFRALIFDSAYDSYKGIIAYVRIMGGEVENNQKISFFAAKVEADIKELGYFKPKLFPEKKLSAGEIGYIATGIKEPSKVRVGDTIVKSQVKEKVEVFPLPGYKEPEPMIFASLYPENPDDFDLLKTGLSKLKLNDPSLIFELETREALGRGFRCGFLGTLHVEIVSERLHRELNLNLIISTPSVVYKIINPVRNSENGKKVQKDNISNGVNQKGDEKFVYGANDWPDLMQNVKAEEPWVSLEIITPSQYIGRILDLFKGLRGNYMETKYITPERVILIYEIPLEEIIANLYDKIKSASQGYASMSYKILEFRTGDLVKMEILIAGKKEKAFSKIVPKVKALQEGRKLVKKLKENLPPQQFSIALQAVVGGDIIARETLKARRKDVTSSLYGGDYSRKRKLLEKQKKGKKKLKEKGKIRIPSKVFLEVFKG